MPFSSMKTEADYLACCKIHTELKKIKESKTGHEKIALSKICGELFALIFIYERNN